EAVHAGLGGGVVGLPVLALLAVDRAGLHDAAPLALAHAFDHRAGDVVAGVEVGGDDVGPLLGSHLVEGGVAGDAGVVDQDLDGAECLFDPAHHGFGLIGRRHVALDQGEVEAFRLHRLLPGARLLLAAVIGRDPVPGLGQALADGSADAAGSPGNQRNP